VAIGECRADGLAVKELAMVSPAVLLLFEALAATGPSFSVELTVRESAGVHRSDAPISAGVPLPLGRFFREQSFVLFQGDGREIACQVVPLVVETDQSLRWVLLDFQDNVAAGAVQRYTLKAGTPTVRSSARIELTETDAALQLDTGKMQLSISRNQPFGLVRSVRAGNTQVVRGGRVYYEVLEGRTGWDDRTAWKSRRLTAGPPDRVRVVYAGPLRATVEIEGRFQDDPNGLGYKAWLTTWAGSSRVHVKYKLRNSNPGRYSAVLVGRSAIELDLAENVKETLLGAKEPLSIDGDGWLHQGLLVHDKWQDVPEAVRAGHGERTLWTGSGPGDRVQGWLAARGDVTVFAADRLLASNPARRIAVDQNRLVLEGIAARFDGPPDVKFRQDRRIGEPWSSPGCWLYDCSHHSSEYRFDFAASGDANELAALSRTAQNRLWAIAPGEYYSHCEVLGSGRFGTLDDERSVYEQWNWSFEPSQLPKAPEVGPGAFVAAEDNHGESEADSVQGLLLMYLRTGDRGWFDQAEAWARYHMDLQTWRTDGWAWKDGGIWFPSGGPQGNRPVREPWNFAWGPPWGDRAKSPECVDLQRLSMSKSCYCHFYGSGLADYYCLTGDPDALAAAVDNVEQKDDEDRHYQDFRPGESAIGSIRGFGRGFEVMVRVLQADPNNAMIRDLCRLCARTLWESPLLDERGFHCSLIGGGFGGMKTSNLSPPIRRWMEENQIQFTTEGDTVDRLSKGDKSWPVRCMGGTWQHVYVQNGADEYARYFDDEDMRDFVIAFGQMSARYMLSPKCHQTWYYTYFDVPDLGHVFDPWLFEHTDTRDGEGCVHSGWYTRFYPDACAKAYSLTGESSLLDNARDFWNYGSKREYQTRQPNAGPGDVGRFAGHTPPKDDTVLEVSRLFYEISHPRRDTQPPDAIRDLQARWSDDNRVEVSFAAPADVGPGRVVRYQVKAATLPIVPYDEWDFARDDGIRRNWWRAMNCQGEPAPSTPGTRERFVVANLPDSPSVYLAVRSFDDSNNRSAISNVVEVVRPRQAAATSLPWLSRQIIASSH